MKETFVVTGAAGGLGWAIVEALAARHPAHFALVDVNGPVLDRRAAQLRESGVAADCFTTDLSNEAAVAGMDAGAAPATVRPNARCTSISKPSAKRCATKGCGC